MKIPFARLPASEPEPFEEGEEPADSRIFEPFGDLAGGEGRQGWQGRQGIAVARATARARSNGRLGLPDLAQSTGQLVAAGAVRARPSMAAP